MTRKTDFPKCENPEHFQKILRALFVSRRKTVKNNLTAFYSGYGCSEKTLEILEKANIKPTVRAEELSLEQLLHLSDVSNFCILK